MSTSMKKILFAILITIASINGSYAQDTTCYTLQSQVRFDTIPYMMESPTFQRAYNELAEMMAVKEKYNFKRAAFLVDWAYNDGNRSYTAFCQEIGNITRMLKSFIFINNASAYKTASNWALFEYFTKSNSLNGNRPFLYDFEDFKGEYDFNKLLVTKVLKSHSGQCTSLPMLYKIICDEMGGHSKLALAPNHMYVKHIGEDGRWVNVELTNGSFARDEWYLQTFGVSTEAVRSGTFLCALSDTENLAFMLQMLALAYKQKYGGYDYFTLKCVDKALEYAPKFCQALVVKYMNLVAFKDMFVKRYGKIWSDFVLGINNEMERIEMLLDNSGYSQITDAEYQQNVKRAIDEIKSKK